MHVFLHGQNRAVSVNGTVGVSGGRLRSFVVDSRLPCVTPVGPRDSKGTTDVASAAGGGVTRRDRLADTGETLLCQGKVLVR